MNIQSVAVLGSGQMGSGIAQVCASAGYAVWLYDLDESILNRALASIGGSLDRLIKKGVLSPEQKNQTLGRLKIMTQLEGLKSVDLAIEAIPEQESLKRQLFQHLDEILPAQSILASNTSSISITRLASCTRRPQQVVGIHFMNPVPVMKLVEVIRGLQTSQETLEVALKFCSTLDKTPVQAKDFPGFIVNRILMPMINEAVAALHEGVASAEHIDLAMKLGTNQPMGPLALADFIGLDTCLFIMNVLHQGLGDSKYRPCPLLKQYVDAGRLGKKSGRGFYEYGAE
jgi:3-hydroxybutyryl-CoA dehydrogenase